MSRKQNPRKSKCKQQARHASAQSAEPETAHRADLDGNERLRSAGSNQTQALGNPNRNAGGPRTERGKAISRKNAIKFGFFAKEVVIEGPDSRESQRDFLRLCRALADYWRPVGAAEILQIELAAVQLFQLRPLLRVRRLLTLESTTPVAPKVDWQQNIQFGEAAKRTDQKGNDTAEQAGPIPADPSRVEKLPQALPLPVHLEWLQRCEAHIMRLYYRAISELQNMQRLRLGEGVPSRGNHGRGD